MRQQRRQYRPCTHFAWRWHIVSAHFQEADRSIRHMRLCRIPCQDMEARARTEYESIPASAPE